MQKIILDNRDTENIHIDTYQMFTGDTHDELAIDYEREKQQNYELDYDSFDWTYDHAAIVKDFAKASIDIIEQAISNTEYAKIITNIEYLASGSPKFYNYTTDWYTATYTCNVVALHNYIAANYDAVTAIAKTYNDYTITGEVSKENLAHATVCHILNNCITADDYNMAMWEKESEIYSENTTYTLIAK